MPSDVFATIVAPFGTTRKSYKQCGYRIVIPECPPNPETKPPVKVRIGREFASVIRCHCRAVVRAGPTAIRTVATGTDRIPF